MTGWTRPASIPPPPPAGPVWGVAAPGAGLPGFPVPRIASIYATLVGAVRAAADGRWTVDAGDDPATAGPTITDGAPTVRLVPSAGPAEYVCQSGDQDGCVYRVPIRVAITATVGSADPTASMAFWVALAQAIYPPPPELESLGVGWVKLEAPGWGSTGPDHGIASTGTGAILLLVYVDLPNRRASS